MKVLKTQPSLARLQSLFWIFAFLIQMISLLAMDSLAESVVYALLNTVFYAAIVYGNILLLYPSLYQRGKKVAYVAVVIPFLVCCGLLRAFASIRIYQLFFADHVQPVSDKAILSYVLGGFMVFLLSFIFRIALAYFALKSINEDILAQKTQAELNLLKSQVQPHFLFNTLNNIYYEAYIEAPRTATLIEQLSGIMRYFVDESPKAFVPLATEIYFIKNYIALEQIRIRYGIDCKFTVDADESLPLPPMLLVTFIENIFKHGIDKTSMTNKIEINISKADRFLVFSTKNAVRPDVNRPTGGGFGLANLRDRLHLLYQDNFELTTVTEQGRFCATLKIPTV